jgi:hypothetical protein
MPHSAGQIESEVPPGRRCTRCGAAVEGTCHTRTGYAVGYYLLHTGPTGEATIRRGDDESALTYLRLLDVVEIVSCPRCFAEPEVQRLWAAFGGPAGGGLT